LYIDAFLDTTFRNISIGIQSPALIAVKIRQKCITW